MKRARWFRQSLVITLLIVFAFIWVGFIASRLAFRFASTSTPTEPKRLTFYARLIDRLDSRDRIKALSEIQELEGGGPISHMAIVDENGKLLYPPGMTLGFVWSEASKPSSAYESVSFSKSKNTPIQDLIRFSGTPTQYLYSTRRGGERGGFWRLSGPFVWTFSSLIVSVVLGVAFSMILLFRSLREKAALADSVLAELQSGNLKARFPIKKMDEFGLAMSRFNRMADEIERLVEQLKGVEKSRMTLLQELAHDLRTPVASQKNLLEVLQSKSDKMDAPLRQELLTLALKESDYFERLVEDLLVLAQVSEPRYHVRSEQVRMNDLLADEGARVASEARSSEKPVELKELFPSQQIEVRGDAHLLRRMIRNAINNAFSFARSEVRVILDCPSAENLRILIEDDGPGFSAEALASFGERRVSRILGVEKGQRLSVGLGSVILRTVAQVHGGSIKAENMIRDGRVIGARVSIFLPALRDQ